jgi:hypothetical protein
MWLPFDFDTNIMLISTHWGTPRGAVTMKSLQSGPYIYEPAYDEDLAVLASIGLVPVVRHMERTIVESNGYPPGSTGMYLPLARLFNDMMWQEFLDTLEMSTPGSAFKILKWIETQRAYSFSGISIVYTILPDPYAIVFHAASYGPFGFLRRLMLRDP